ncbi:MAG: ATP-binding protein [Paludibacteraceae bacterium]|nr:ATP-binding protein [Paludibacteraceae bacterium]
MRIGIIGPESSGKSTLGQRLAQETGGTYVEEYARRYVEQSGRPYTQEDVLRIARRQIEEIRAEYERQPVYFDTELIVTKVWLIDKYGSCPPWIEEALRRYPMDRYLICAPDLPFVPDPVRENPHRREELFNWYIEEVKQTGVPYEIVRHEEGTASEQRGKTA